MSHKAPPKKSERELIKDTLPAVVQIVALKKQFMGNLSSAWTGSGTIVDASGLILTNCHVANPRAMGMSAPSANKLAIALTERSDEAPVLTYFAEIVAQDPALDLAVLRIVSDMNGKAVKRLKLPMVPIGDSDMLELGDEISIFGYPGIGGDTITFTHGSVSGFTRQKGVKGRAWVKTDATIAGGNSGGTAVSPSGLLVGIPTQASAGTDIVPVDARPVVDTNRDGRVDQRDTPMAIGGFINGLRPINLAKPILKKAGWSMTGRRTTRRTTGSTSSRPSTRGSSRATGTAPPRRAIKLPIVRNLLFSTRVARDGRPVNPTAVLSGRTKTIYATFEFDNFRNRTKWGQVWSLNGKKIVDEPAQWTDGPRGRKVIQLSSRKTMQKGEYHLAVTYRNQIVAEGKVNVGRQATDSDTEVSGQIIDQRSGRGIKDALVIALKPNVSTRDFVRQQNKDMAQTSARTDRRGNFTFPKQLPKGRAYGLVVVARGYQDVVIDGALRIGDDAPEKAQINPLGLAKG